LTWRALIESWEGADLDLSIGFLLSEKAKRGEKVK